ncbi:HAD-IB family hydrolase [Actinorugispora endophytica]|uniref:HAD superfamily hydrolase (TIGR01490 family) n=1 Tax=Actinorugispora endophytica TaxID=1605990 RepID=A0A4R6UQI6_9ACTN|nr:HAD-IB family hydrolase [Actinorugispora endophytica]TDQ48466.1 HAD superfamily hydrolase (TIGR01490 family) [Actinorugispora endophytica]
MPTAPDSPSAVAFFDVDETLVTIKSMFDFYDYFLEAIGHTPAEQQRLRDDARSLLRPGMPRKEGNRLFYRRFAGYSEADVAAHGRAWFERHLAGGRLFNQDVLAALRRHTEEGMTTVLVSGSFRACLDPIAAYSGANVVLCTGLETRDGVYTGEVVRSMIGDAKADAARWVMRERGVSYTDCYSYGDHTSDLEMLRLVGNPVVVGDNPELVAEAVQKGWRRLAGTLVA